MIKIIEDASATPVCPHCNAAITQLLARKVESFLGVRYLYFCEKCNKTLGVTHRKGFWMG